MNEWYFYQERGKTVGPFNLDDIKGRIRDGRLKVFDLIYKDGDAGWRMVLEHSALRSEFKNSALSGFKDRPWVCLQRKSSESTEFVTTGPYSREEVRDAIQAGSISYSDFAWKDGFGEWKRIGSLEEFNPRVRHASLPPIPKVPEESSADLLKNVVEMQRMNFSLQDYDLPPEVDSDFVAGSSSAMTSPEISNRTDEVTRTAKVTNAEEVTRTVKTSVNDEVTHVNAPVPPVPEPHRPPPFRSEAPGNERKGKDKGKNRPELEHTEVRIQIDEEEDSSRPWMDWGLVGALVLVLAGTVLLISRFVMKPAPMPEIPALADNSQPGVQSDLADLPAVQADSESQPEAGHAAESSTQEEKQHVPKSPESLHLSVQAAGGGQPRLIVRTDGTFEYPVYLQVIGMTGQVSEGGAYYRYLKLTPTGNWMKPIEFGPIRLPQGKFIARAETGELKKEVKFSWGVNDAKWKQNLAQQRKTWAYAIWKERLALYRLSVALEKQIGQAMLPGKRFSGRGWEPLVALKRSSGGNYLMFDDWWELHEIVKEAKKSVNAPLLARAAREREKLASFTIWK